MARRRAYCVTKPVSSPTHLRRSPRLSQLRKAPSQTQPHRHQPLPSPPPSAPRATHTTRKRKSLEPEEPEGESEDRKKVRRPNDSDPCTTELPCDPVEYWAATSTWPRFLMQKSGRPSLPKSKRKSSSTHHSDKQQRLEHNGIHMRSSTLL